MTATPKILRGCGLARSSRISSRRLRASGLGSASLSSCAGMVASRRWIATSDYGVRVVDAKRRGWSIHVRGWLIHVVVPPVLSRAAGLVPGC